MRKDDLIAIYDKANSTVALLSSLRKERKIQLKGFIGSSLSFTLASVARQGGVHLVICADRDEAAYMQNDLDALLRGNTPVFYFPYSFHYRGLVRGY